MKKTFIYAIAGAMAVAGYAETSPLRAAEASGAPQSLEQIRAKVRSEAMTSLGNGDLQTVGRRGGRGWGGRGFRGGRSYGRGRGFGGRRFYGGRGFYGGRRSYGGSRYYGGRRWCGYRRGCHRRGYAPGFFIGIGI